MRLFISQLLFFSKLHNSDFMSCISGFLSFCEKKVWIKLKSHNFHFSLNERFYNFKSVWNENFLNADLWACAYDLCICFLLVSFCLVFFLPLIFNGDVCRTPPLQACVHLKIQPPDLQNQIPTLHFFFLFQKSITLGRISQYGRKDLLLVLFYYNFQVRSHLQKKRRSLF